MIDCIPEVLIIGKSGLRHDIGLTDCVFLDISSDTSTLLLLAAGTSTIISGAFLQNHRKLVQGTCPEDCREFT